MYSRQNFKWVAINSGSEDPKTGDPETGDLRTRGPGPQESETNDVYGLEPIYSQSKFS